MDLISRWDDQYVTITAFGLIQIHTEFLAQSWHRKQQDSRYDY